MWLEGEGKIQRCVQQQLDKLLVYIYKFKMHPLFFNIFRILAGGRFCGEGPNPRQQQLNKIKATIQVPFHNINQGFAN